MYCNAALGDAFAKPGKGGGASGGPDWQLIDVWKVAAPHIDLVAPDIYNRDPKAYAKYLEHYARKDNALLRSRRPETPSNTRASSGPRSARAPSASRLSASMIPAYSNYPLGAKSLDAATIDAFASKYALFAPMARQLGQARLRAPDVGHGEG